MPDGQADGLMRCRNRADCWARRTGGKAGKCREKPDSRCGAGSSLFVAKIQIIRPLSGFWTLPIIQPVRHEFIRRPMPAASLFLSVRWRGMVNPGRNATFPISV